MRSFEERNKRRSAGLGSVATAVITPTKILLVKDGRPDGLWKLPGGGIEMGETVTKASIRETWEETGVKLDETEIVLHSRDHRGKERSIGVEREVYFPHFCFARVTPEKLETHLPFGDENGDRILVAVFDRAEVPTMLDLLERHRPFITAMERLLLA